LKEEIVLVAGGGPGKKILKERNTATGGGKELKRDKKLAYLSENGKEK